ncbi:MAG: arylsulfatase A-like enzyme [Verrucomicrobiales bacterium]|jgi:arylsulfatase A-like enzyme
MYMMPVLRPNLNGVTLIIHKSFLIIVAGLAGVAHAQSPLVTSWFTARSGQYARIYVDTVAETAGDAVTTWSRGQGVQALPTYAGVHEVCYDATDVYIRTSGLGFHVMGPWYLNAQRTNLFPNYPSNQAVLYRFPLDPGAVPASKVASGLGTIGYFVDGVSMFDSRDAFSYSTANNADAGPMTAYNGDGVWNRDAFVNEGVTFDAGNAHQAGPNYHYHANPPGLRHQLGDSVDFDDQNNTYIENFSGRHSPIIGWVRDGYPIYGPYGYADASTNSSDQTVVHMRSGYQPRDGTNGSTSLAATGRTTLPMWANRLGGRAISVPTNRTGPTVAGQFVLGKYLEDYAYLGDLGMTQGVNFDLNEHNGRFGRTPEFPQGTYAYFVSIEADGTPKFPYNIGPYYYGTPSANTAPDVPANATVHFEGGPKARPTLALSTDDPSLGDVTLLWSGTEGGSYQIDRSANVNNWILLADDQPAPGGLGSLVDTNCLVESNTQVYRARLKEVVPFDDNGFDYQQPGNPYTFIELQISGGGPADLSVIPLSVTLNGQPVTFVSRPAQDRVQVQVALDQFPGGTYTVAVQFAGQPAPQTGTYTRVDKPNILLLILDDWGIDASPLDNPGGLVANMPTLQTLAAGGLRFTQAYAQPICSPTRATIITGRQPFRHGVGNPTVNSTLPPSELTLPEIFTAESAGYALGSFGKWHLGGGADGPYDVGGWQKFAGIIQGGVQSYYTWTKSEDRVNTQNFTTYTTSDQVNEAVEFIQTQDTNTPWFVWMGFNAPHDPFDDPPPGLAPPGGFSTQAVGESADSWNYRKSLEALDTEIARLLSSVDMAKTDVILIGDNGTPGQTVQAPFGNGHNKGDLYQGGIHVPMVVCGPSVTVAAGSTTDKLVHCVDLFSTILQLAGIDDQAATSGVTLDSNSILPILQGSDTAARCVVAEKFGDGNGDGRAIITDAYPDYKLIIFGDKDSSLDDPTFEFYHIGSDINETNPIPPATHQAAYDALIAKDAELGGGYSDPATGPMDILYIELLDPPGQPNVPSLVNPNGNAIHPVSVTVDGIAATYLARVNQGPDINDESDDGADQFWVKVRMSPPQASYTNAEVTFNTAGNVRSFNQQQILVKP